MIEHPNSLNKFPITSYHTTQESSVWEESGKSHDFTQINYLPHQPQPRRCRTQNPSIQRHAPSQYESHTAHSVSPPKSCFFLFFYFHSFHWCCSIAVISLSQPSVLSREAVFEQRLHLVRDRRGRESKINVMMLPVGLIEPFRIHQYV